MIELARYYAEQGWRVFPVTPNAKTPAIPKERGGRGCLDATRNTQMIERWWNEFPMANIGLATGEGTLVIDVDPRKSDSWLDALNSLKLPPTFTVKTPNGWHLYFSMPPDKRITVGTDLVPGVDWRGERGYVLGTGSMVNGITYTTAKSLPVARAPESLLERIRTRKKLSRPVPDADGHMVIPDGARNETLFALACLLRRFGLEYNATLEALRAANSDHCEPPLPDEELRIIAASAMKYQQTPRESA